MSKNLNAIDFLSHIMQQRCWYGDKIERRKAAVYKGLNKSGRLSYEKCCEILQHLGYNKIKEEVWN